MSPLYIPETEAPKCPEHDLEMFMGTKRRAVYVGEMGFGKFAKRPIHIWQCPNEDCNEEESL